MCPFSLSWLLTPCLGLIKSHQLFKPPAILYPQLFRNKIYEISVIIHVLAFQRLIDFSSFWLGGGMSRDSALSTLVHPASGQCWELRVIAPGHYSWLCCWPVIWPWACHITPLRLSFYFHKIETIKHLTKVSSLFLPAKGGIEMQITIIIRVWYLFSNLASIFAQNTIEHSQKLLTTMACKSVSGPKGETVQAYWHSIRKHLGKEQQVGMGKWAI